MKNQLLATSLQLILVAAVASAAVDPTMGEKTPASRVRIWYEIIVSRADADRPFQCGEAMELFDYSTRYFSEPDALSEFAVRATEEDSLPAWIARWKVAVAANPKAEPATAMIESSHACVGCFAVNRIWLQGSRRATVLRGTQEEEIRGAWEALGLQEERFRAASRLGELAQVTTFTRPLEGRAFYFRLVDGHWTLVCQSGSWIA